MPNSTEIPTDLSQIQQEISELLETTPQTSERGRLFWLLDAALSAVSGGNDGGGVPMSKEGVVNIHSQRPMSGDYKVTVDFGMPYGWYHSAKEALLPVPETKARNTNKLRVQPTVVEDPKVHGLMVGVHTLHLDENGTLILRRSADSNRGRVLNEWSVGVGGDFDKSFMYAVVDSFNPGYSLADNSMYVVVMSRATPSALNLMVYSLERDNKLVQVGTTTTVDFATDRDDLSSFYVSACRAGNSIATTGSLVISVCSRDNRSIVLFNLVSHTVTTVASDAFGSSYGKAAVARQVYSYNPDAYGFLVQKGLGSNTCTFELYSFDRSTNTATLVGEINFDNTGYSGLELIQISPVLNGDTYGYLIGSPYLHNNGQIPYSLWTPGATGDELTHHTVDISAFDSNEYYTDRATFIPDNDAYAPFETFFVGLKSKTNPHMSLIRPQSKTSAGCLPLPDTKDTLVSCSGMDDYFAYTYLHHSSSDVFVTAFESWAWWASYNQWSLLGAPDRTVITEPNYLGAPLMVQPNEVSKVEDKGNRYVTYLPKVNSVVELNADGVYTIPKDAPIGTAWTLTSDRDYLDRSPNASHSLYLGSVVAEFTDGSVKDVCSLRGLATAVGRLSLAVHIVKTGEKTFKVTNLI